MWIRLRKCCARWWAEIELELGTLFSRWFDR